MPHHEHDSSKGRKNVKLAMSIIACKADLRWMYQAVELGGLKVVLHLATTPYWGDQAQRRMPAGYRLLSAHI